MTAREFRRTLYTWYKKHGRHDLPWRQTTDPYKIFISELMLQQTQAERVVPKYKNFLRKFPSAQVLAKAKSEAVLKLWQGLGYNRRALFAKRACESVVAHHKGIFPQTLEELQKLPGIGPYTARAIFAFAYNKPCVLVETNIRTVIIHHFFPKKKKVSDKEIGKVVEEMLDVKNPRLFYSAMMDYGAYLKKQGIKTHRKSSAYKKQSVFKDSFRQIRGVLVKAYVKEGYMAVRKIVTKEKERKAEYQLAFAALTKEGLSLKSDIVINI